MLLPRTPMVDQVRKELIERGEIEAVGSGGVQITPITFWTEQKVREGMNDLLPRELSRLARDGWRLICYDSGEDSYILAR